VTNTSAARTIRPENGVSSGLSGYDFLLEGRQQLLRFGQSQTQIGDIPEIIGAIDLHDVRGPPLALGAGFHQPQNPAHTSTPGQTTDARNTLLAPIPPILRQSPYKGRNIIERAFSRHKDWRRAATR
jgi:hypothetical protein